MTDFKQRVKDFCDDHGNNLMYGETLEFDQVDFVNFKDPEGRVDWRSYNKATEAALKKLLEELGISSLEEVDRYGGEGMGSDYWAIIKFTDKDSGDVLHVKCYGWYQSHYGSEYEGYCFVQPKQVVKTEWS